MDLPDDPKQTDIDAALDHVRDGITEHARQAEELPPCSEEDHLGRACVYGEGHDLSTFPHRFEGPVTRRPDGEQTDVGPVAPAPGLRPELYDQDRRVFASGVLYDTEVTVDVAADSPEGVALTEGQLDGLSVAVAPTSTDELREAARTLVRAVAAGQALVAPGGSDGGGRTVWRVTGTGANLVQFSQAHVREALAAGWLVVGTGGQLAVSPLVGAWAESPFERARDADRRRTTAEARFREAVEESFRRNPDVSP